VKRAGAVAVSGLVLILVALTFEAAPLFVPGVAITLLGIVAPAWVTLAARGASIERTLGSERVIEDEPIEATIEVRRGPWGLPGAVVEDPLAGDAISIRGPMSMISGGSSASVRIVASFPRRGMRRIDPPTLVVSDALELARAERVSLSPAQEILVLPRTERVKWVPGAGEKWRRATGAAPLEPFGATEVDGLRPYRQGTPASRIHWAAFARGAGLLERRLRSDTETRPLVVVDARVDESAHSSEHLDAAVRAAASLVLELGTRTGCGLLLPGEFRPLEVEKDLIAWPVAHARLALVEGGPGTRAPGLAPGARSAQVLYVAAAPHARLPAGLASAGVRAAILVVPKALANHPRQQASFEVAGCVGFVVGAGRRVRERAA
jgi:uncharacterized protein (DUF58 family)